MEKLEKVEEKMKFTLGERITLLGVLPKEANFVTLRIVRSLESKLSFSEEEMKDFEVKISSNGSSYSWNKEGVKHEVEIEFGEKATDIVVEQLKELDKTKKLTGQHFTIYEKFIGEQKIN